MKRWHIVLFAVPLVGLLVFAMPAAGQGGADRPFNATLTGAATYAWPGAYPSSCTVVTTVTDATGQATHMGRVVFAASHCPAEPAYVIDGRLTITAANGDTLSGQYDYDPASTSPSIAGAWTGGTGRFAGASGAAVLTFKVVPQFVAGCNPSPNPSACFDFFVPWPWSATIIGTISY